MTVRDGGSLSQTQFAASQAFHTAAALHDQGRAHEAAKMLEVLLRRHPDHFDGLTKLGVIRAQEGRFEDAAKLFRRALYRKPVSPETHNNLGNVLKSLGRAQEALAHYAKALLQMPSYAEAYNNMGNALRDLGRDEEAIAAYRRALEIRPALVEALSNLGAALSELGRFDEAQKAFEQALRASPRAARFYRHIGACTRFVRGDSHVAAMEELARSDGMLAEEDRWELHFALAKAYDDLGDNERSFREVLEANALRRRRIVYREDAALGLLDRIRAAFPADLMKGVKSGDDSRLPLFIVGMPRSGTTLVEQILASHPLVFGAGELPQMDKIVASLGRRSGAPGEFPDVVRSLTADQLRGSGAAYLAAVRPLSPAAERITDKMPTNFHFVGLIHLALPNARIIHIVRDPIDTCLSCFSQVFTGNVPFAYDLGELGRYYRGYERLMAHWRSVLPAGVMLDVRYEDLVADLEGEAHRIIAHAGLEWDDACLAFHKTTRPVRTASAAQVRQPIYRSSIGRWRPYRHFIGPLFEGLGITPKPTDG